MSTDEFLESVADLNRHEKVIKALENDMLFDYIGVCGHEHTNSELTDIIKEFGYATFDALRREADIYTDIRNAAAEELTNRWL